MVAAMAANRNDCTPNARMLVASQRCATIMICSTSTSAAIIVISLLPNCGSCQNIVSSKKERRYQRHGAQHKSHREQFRHAEDPQFGVTGLHQHHHGGQQQKLPAE